MAEWGRKEYSKAWPSRTPVWTWGAILLTFVFLAGMLTLQYERSWSAAERLYLTDYLKSGARGKASATAASKYTLLEAVVGPNQKQGQRLVIGDEIEEVPSLDGRPGYRLTEEGMKDGIARLTWVTATFNDRGLHRVMGEAVYGNIGSWEFYRQTVWASLAFFVLALFVAVPRDRARRMIWKHGRRLRGPELVSTAEFNEKLGRSKGLRVHLPDGVAFINEEQSWYDRTFHKALSCWARIPRDREAMHFLIVDDSGTGKSAAIRQMLAQISDRGEAAIVYDPAMEYLPQFYSEQRGDVVLNPLDARCPFWSPGDEVAHEAEALTLAASLFPEQGRENRFFVEASRKNFAPLNQSEADAGAAHVLDVQPARDRPTRSRNRDGGDDRPGGGGAAQRCVGVVEHGGGCVQAAAQRVGDTAQMEHGRVGRAAQGLGVLNIEADDARADASAHQPVA
jgi:hypothetical protein